LTLGSSKWRLELQPKFCAYCRRRRGAQEAFGNTTKQVWPGLVKKNHEAEWGSAKKRESKIWGQEDMKCIVVGHSSEGTKTEREEGANISESGA